MEKVIYAEQTLHGYANGHQLLASSCKLEMDDRKKMDELSDLSGRHDGVGFVDYYTGYPLDGGRKYVISKTWYAQEMTRPGCVWTHSLILDTDDLCHLLSISELMDSFHRPTNLNYEMYTHPLPLLVGEKKHFPPYDTQQLQYEIFTMCSSATPKYVLVDDASIRLENEFFMVLCSLPQEILKTFTFCTMSYDVRKDGDSVFQYQILPETRRIGLTRYYTQAVVCEEFYSIKKYPYWIDCYMRALLQNSLDSLYDFIRQYGAACVTLDFFSQFSRLYFALNGETEISLTDYIDSVDTLFPSDRSISLKTVELVLNDRFFPNVFADQEYQILEILEMKHLVLGKDQQEKLAYKITRNAPEKLYPYLKRYIVGALSARTCESVEKMIHMLSPNALRKASCMDRNICFVLIRKNSELLFCPDLWQQPKDFQQEIICAIDPDLESERLKNLLVIVLRVDVENIAEDLYRVFGERLLPVLYGAFNVVRSPNRERLAYWTPILLRNQKMLIEGLWSLPDLEWRQDLFLKLDVSNDGLLQHVKKNVWLRLYREFFTMGSSLNGKVDVAIQFFPVVFCTNYHFEDEFIRDVVGTVYREVKANKMSSDTWSRFQYILPQVEDYQAWDRCLRIRRALEEKGYPVSIVEP